MDITDTLIPNSDQLDAADLAASGPRIFTVKRVSKGNPEQPVQVYFEEFDKPWRPGRNMRRVLAHCWGKNSDSWPTKKIELYCDPDVHFGKEQVGGTRISRLSHINGTISAPIIIGRGKRGSWKVTELKSDAPAPHPNEAKILELRGEWASADPERRQVIEAAVAELQGGAQS